MRERERDPADRVQALRDEFDRAFALPSPARPPAPLYLLTVGVGGSRLAFRVSEVEGVLLDPAVAKVPGAPSPLLGIATVRGQLWPVYDLGQLMGQGSQARPRVLCLARSARRVAFACDHFHGLTVVPAESLKANSTALGHGEVIVGDDGVVPVLSLTALAGRCIENPHTGNINEEGPPA